MEESTEAAVDRNQEQIVAVVTKQAGQATGDARAPQQGRRHRDS